MIRGDAYGQFSVFTERCRADEQHGQHQQQLEQMQMQQKQQTRLLLQQQMQMYN